MKNLCLIILSLILFLPSYSQYFGGNEDGISFAGTGQTGINDQDLYCSGGPEDGFACNEIISAINYQENYCNGGIGDGYARIFRPGQSINAQSIYCSGGNDDGFYHGSITSHLFNSVQCYSGGYDDGHSLLSTGEIALFDQSFYLSGGMADGFSDGISGYHTLNNQEFYVSGGFDDGHSEVYSGMIPVCNTSLYASGGEGDGFQGLLYAGPMVFSPAWYGGNQDGFGKVFLPPFSFSASVYCLGGPDDGAFSLSLAPTYFGPGIWLGSVSPAWEDPANWSGNVIPDISIDVVVPPGRLRYPFIQAGSLTVNHLQGSHICKSLTIQPGGSVVNKSDLILYGNMTVSGFYQGDDNVNNHVYIYPGGHLKIDPPGQMLIGQP